MTERLFFHRAHMKSLLAAAVVVVAMATTSWPAQAQMPDLRQMVGKPLGVPDLPPGTVVVRVARQTPANAAADVEVIATVREANGDARTRAARTLPDGRASFEGLVPRAVFQAVATVDGERLETETFTVPVRGGIRVMLVAGLGPATGEAAEAPPAMAADGPPENAFRMGATTGTTEPAADLPAGTLELFLKDAQDQPVVGQKVTLGEVSLLPEEEKRGVRGHEAVTDAEGRARFEGLTTGSNAGYAAVAQHEGMRISTQPFRMPEDTGMRGRLLALGRTQDPAVLQFDQRTKVVVDIREEALAIMMGLFFRNTSTQIFDPGPEGLVIPLPDDAVNAQEISGGVPVEVISGVGIKITTPIPPDSAAAFVTTARFGYILPSGGASSLKVEQVMPVAVPTPPDTFLLVPQKTGLELSGPGVRRLGPEVDGAGEKVNVYTTPPIAAGATLAFTVTGIPAYDRKGRYVAAFLCLLLLGAAIAWGGGVRSGAKGAGKNRDALVERREKLFAELVDLERERRVSADANGRLTGRRRTLIAELESVYRDLARLD